MNVLSLLQDADSLPRCAVDRQEFSRLEDAVPIFVGWTDRGVPAATLMRLEGDCRKLCAECPFACGCLQIAMAERLTTVAGGRPVVVGRPRTLVRPRRGVSTEGGLSASSERVA